MEWTRERIVAEVEARIAQERAEFGPEAEEEAKAGTNGGLSGEFVDRCAREGELGDARLFIALAKDRFAFDHAAARWFRFTGAHWEEDVLGEVYAALQGVTTHYTERGKHWAWARLKAAKEKNRELERKAAEWGGVLARKIASLQRVRHARDVLTFSAAGADSLGITGEEWDRDPWALGVRNGVLDLRTGDFRPGRPGDYIRKIAPVEWRGPGEPCPHWERFLREILQDQTEKVSYLQRLFGYALTGLTVEHVLPIFWGEGRNGKGTLIETANYVLGPLAGPIEAEMLLQQAHPKASGGPTSDVMALRGRRLAWASETDEGRRFNSGKVKWYVGGDSLTGRDPYGRRQVTFAPSHLLILLTNRKPHAPADDFAFWARIHLLEFGLQFVDNPVGPNQRKRDPAIAEKLRAEASGILAWLVRGCLEWQRQGGLNPPASVRAATESYREAEDVIGAFLADSCEEGPTLTVKAGTLYKTYREWCLENGHKAGSNARFKERMTARFAWTRDKAGAFFSGLALQENRVTGDER